MSDKFIDIYPNYDLNTLPDYIRDDIENIIVIGKSKKVLLTKDGKKYHIGNPLNDLSGAEWTYFTNSIISTNYSTTGENNHAYKIRKIHPSPKPPALLIEIIKFFTKKNETVLDFFMGVGGTLLAASMTNRKALGIELNPKYIEAYKRANKYLNLKEQYTIIGDSEEILNSKIMNDSITEKASLILIDPPYSDMMSRRKTGEEMRKHGKISTPFTSHSSDLGNMTEEKFWEKLLNIVNSSLKYLKIKGHLVVFIKDLQPKDGNTNLLHAKMIEKLNQLSGLRYVGLKIWVDQTAKLFPYGYPYSFVATQIHQYILIFKKDH